MTRYEMTVTRRLFLKTTAAAGGGLMLGGFVPGAAQTASAAGLFEPNVWVKITPDGKARIMLSMLEMGQGVMTAMPMLLAEELDIDWANVTTEWAPADARYGNPNFGGSQTTAGSNSTRGMWKLLRESGATARAMLVTAAAKDWGVAESTCTTDKGVVIHQASGRRATYGSLVDKAAAVPVPTNVALKDPKAFTLLGRDVARLDIPEKVNGQACFGVDVKLPGLLVARVVRCPVFGGKVASFNADKAKAVPGVKHVVQIASGIAVVADGYWAASNGAKALQITWDEGPLATLTSAEITKRYADLAQKPGVAARKDGDFDAAFAKGAKTIERVFEAPYLAHACMEPMNCTANVAADRCDVYVPTQSQTVTQQVAMAVSGLPQPKVFVHTTYMGGGFGRRGEGDFVADAVETSKKVGAPVKVMWSREDDIQHDYYRPVTYVRMWAALDGTGKPTAWQQRIVQSSLMKKLKTDPGIPYGFWRSVGSSVNGYVTEAFIDEMATAAGKDPYEFRRQLLADHPRHRAVLEMVADKAGWKTPPAQGRARGIAVHECFGSIIGLVSEVSVTNGTVRVHKNTCVVDCGWVVHPDTIKAQMEGGLAYGLAAALKGEITINNGRVVQSTFADYQPLRHNEMPQTDVFIVPSVDAPGGIGEPSTAAMAGALVNAVFAATGKRIYSLPIKAAVLRGGTAE